MAPSAAATEFRATLDALGLTQIRTARLFNVGSRSVRRWQDGTRRVPLGIDILFRLLVMGVVTIEQVEIAAAASPAAWMNGSGRREPSAPRPVEPAPEQSALACAETTSLADPGPSIAEKVYALALDACRYPYGNLEHPEEFYFCGAPIARGSYCQRHLDLVYLPPRTGSGHGGFVAHGRPSIPGAFSATGASRPPISRVALPIAHRHPLDHGASPC